MILMMLKPVKMLTWTIPMTLTIVLLLKDNKWGQPMGHAINSRLTVLGELALSINGLSVMMLKAMVF